MDPLAASPEEGWGGPLMISVIPLNLERTEKLPMGSIKNVVSEPIEGHEDYHMMVSGRRPRPHRLQQGGESSVWRRNSLKTLLLSFHS